MEERESLIKRFSESGFALTDTGADSFLRYAKLLVEKNKVMNLTAITELPDIIEKHFLDSIMLFHNDFLKPEIREAKSFIDVGTGAGFPGIPLKIMRPDISLCLLDALQKRIGFLKEVGENLSLSDVTYRHDRSEDAGKSELRETFDIAVARAVAALPILLEYTLPFVKAGGYFVAYKSGNSAEEIQNAEKALSILGGKITDVREYTIPGTDYERTLIYIRKTKNTPPKFPRKAGKIEKEPLL